MSRLSISSCNLDFFLTEWPVSIGSSLEHIGHSAALSRMDADFMNREHRDR